MRPRNIFSPKHRINPLRLPSSAVRFRGSRPHRLLLLALGSCITLAGCRSTIPAFGPTRTVAAANAHDFFSAAAYRFVDVRRDRKYGAARMKFGRYALTPSKIFGDTSMWTARGASHRALVLVGGYANGHYTMAAAPVAPVPSAPAEARHLMHLQRLRSDDEYLWTTDVDFAIGRITAAQAADVFMSLFRAAEGRSGHELSADYRAAFPRAAAAFGRLFSIDSIRSIPHAAAGTTVELSISVHAERLRRTYPAFAKYVDKYVAPARYRMIITDRAGTRFFTTAAAKNRITIRARVKNGELVALEGPPRPMPDDLLLHSEAFAKFGVFTVGASDIVSELDIVRTGNERGWFLRFNKEPDWHLPLAAATLLRAPLRRPFAGGGATFRLTVRDAPGAQSVISRRTTTAVQESAILRFLGALSSSAINDFAGKSEEEENRFWVEGFTALRADAAAVAGTLPAS